MKNNHCENSLYLRGLEYLSKEEKPTFKELYKKLEEVANNGKPFEFQDHTRRIRYCTRDQYKKFCLHWVVVNVVSGRKQIFYTKDFIGAAGGIYWRNLASAIRSV